MTNYEKSNSVETVAPLKIKSAAYKKLLVSEDIVERQRLSQQLLDELNDAYGLPSVSVYVFSKSRPRSEYGNRTIEKYGNYNTVSRIIRIFNLTAVKKQQVSAKSFVDTLLHEFIHHYDTYFMKIRTIHTAGFYKRISDLKSRLGN